MGINKLLQHQSVEKECRVRKVVNRKLLSDECYSKKEGAKSQVHMVTKSALV